MESADSDSVSLAGCHGEETHVALSAAPGGTASAAVATTVTTAAAVHFRAEGTFEEKLSGHRRGDTVILGEGFIADFHEHHLLTR